MKRMLFNATHSEELRVAVVDGQTLVDLDIDFINNESKKGNIYKGKITKIEPSLEAVFVDYGAPRQGFLSLKGVSLRYFSNYSASTPMAQVKVQDVLNVGDSLIVQVEKEERGNKGAALTTFISLAGRFLVLLPHNPRGGGISRQIEGANRHKLEEIVNQLDLPEEHSIIARTAGIGQSAENFQTDLQYLVNLWKRIEKAASEQTEPFLIYQESSLIVRALRDYMRDDISEILIDDKEIFSTTKKFVSDVMPSSGVLVKHHDDNNPLFSRFQIEHQIERAFQRKVDLPTGGSIIIDQTEALVTIDVNSARSTKGGDIEETAFQTNIEAVEQIAKQLRVRDIGGLIVIDLIDMSTPRNKRSVEKRLSDSLRHDRARVQTGKISRFGLLEMSRQRLRTSIEEASHDSCPRCHGRGFIRSVTSSALHILRILEEDALKENTELIHAHLPVEIATFLLNEKRHEINQIEKRLATRIVVIPTPALQTPNYHIVRLGVEDLESNDSKISYTLDLPEKGKENFTFVITTQPNARTIATVDESLVALPPVKANSDSLIKRVVKGVFGASNSEAEPNTTKTSRQSTGRNQHRRRKPSAKRSYSSGRNSARQNSGRASHSGRNEGRNYSSRPPRQFSGNNKSGGRNSGKNEEGKSDYYPRKRTSNSERKISGNR